MSEIATLRKLYSSTLVRLKILFRSEEARSISSALTFKILSIRKFTTISVVNFCVVMTKVRLITNETWDEIENVSQKETKR